MNLVLIGYRGSGKTSLAGELGLRLARPVVSLDQQIVQRTGRSIPEIVAERGWSGFRDLEQEVCAEYARRDGLVLDTGGGVVERPENVALLRANGKLVWLRAQVATIVSRIRHDDQRPALSQNLSFVDEVSEILERRTPLYRRAADLEVDTDGRSISELADEVIAWFNRLGEPRAERSEG